MVPRALLSSAAARKQSTPRVPVAPRDRRAVTWPAAGRAPRARQGIEHPFGDGAPQGASRARREAHRERAAPAARQVVDGALQALQAEIASLRCESHDATTVLACDTAFIGGQRSRRAQGERRGARGEAAAAGSGGGTRRCDAAARPHRRHRRHRRRRRSCCRAIEESLSRGAGGHRGAQPLCGDAGRQPLAPRRLGRGHHAEGAAVRPRGELPSAILRISLRPTT